MRQDATTGQADNGPILGLAIDRPWLALLGALVLVFVMGAGLTGVSKDPSVDAFVPLDHPAALARDRANEIFGLEDPVIVALAAPAGETSFTPAALSALREIDQRSRLIEGVKKNDVVSLASENAIRGEEGDLLVEPIVEDGTITQSTAELAWQRFQSMPMLANLLASENGDLLTVIIPVEDPNHAEGAVAAIKTLAGEQAPPNVEVHVAGVAAMNARLGAMVNGDTRIFIPVAVLTVIAILLFALRKPKALVGPLVVIAGSAAAAIGMMGWLGAKYYLITTALPVVIMAIAVADSLHITTYFLRARALDPQMTAQAAARDALQRAWLPVTLTSITTIAAFVGLSFGAAMKPISEFGYFAAVGVGVAWVLSLTALPAILVLLNIEPSKSAGSIARHGMADRLIEQCTNFAFTRPASALASVTVLLVALGFFASDASFDYERQRYFSAGDEVRLADREINARLGGVNFLDVVVTSPEAGGLMTPQAIAAIAELRGEVADLPLVVKVGGVDQYISLMHEALTGAEPGTLPQDTNGPGQYMFLYEASGAPEDFKQEIDYDYANALVRAQLSTDSYEQTLPTVHQLEAVTAEWADRHGLQASISGRVAVNDGWMTRLSETHFVGLGMALTLVFLTTLIVFRSLTYSILAMTPVAVGVLTVYAAMGAFGIDIAPATSMTAAIATGLGVDFGIHLISLVRSKRAAGASLKDAFDGTYTVVARACFYSAVALGFALLAIALSSAPPLRWFGMLVAVGAFGSLIGALLIVPAIWASTATLVERKLDDAIPV
ncbi:putative membrane protein [Altererythrobacter insulae]|nr:putative membrane protein [Altererythrobacter insulae]